MLTAEGYRRIALGFEGAIEKAHMGHPDFRVNGRMFATIHSEERGALSLTPDQQRIFVHDRPEVFVPENGAWGLQGWTRVMFGVADEESVGEAMTLAWQNKMQAVAKKKSTPDYSGTPLAKKLGIKDASRVCVVNPPSNYLKLVAPLPRDARISDRLSGDTDIVHVFTTTQSELAKRLTSLRAQIQPDAAIWVSWPKKASGQPTDITEHTIRAVALPIGLVDVKVCAVDETWTGFKLVIRKELRPKRKT